MKKNLYYFNWQLQANVFGVVVDDLTENLSDEIIFVSCKGSLLPCWSNLNGDLQKCQICKFNQKSAFNHGNLSKIKQLYIDDYSNFSEVESEFLKCNLGNYLNVQDIKQLNYNNIAIGYGALSTYISATRNLEPIIDNEFRNYFDKILKVELFIKLSIDRIIKEFQPDVISIFNGRIHDTRPVYETAINNNIELRGVETVVKSNLNYQRRVFKNVLPHNIDFNTKSILDAWNNSNLNDLEKIEIARSFYEKRRNNEIAADSKIYTLNQKYGKLPENWNPNLINLVIFNSSEDEFASIGKDWDYKAIFKNQEEGIKYIINNISDPNVHFYLRVHPNLNNIQYGYHKRLYELNSKFSNFTVIASDSAISTYSLMDAADKIVVFGSSTGVEAAYAKKPVILLGGSYYYHLNVAYIPNNETELIEFIKQPLEPKPLLGVYQYGFYLMNIDSYSIPIKFNVEPINFIGKFFGYKFPHLKIFNSSILYKLLILLLRAKNEILNIFFKKNLFQIPIKENK